MQDRILLLIRYLYQYIAYHEQNHNCYKNEKDLLVWEHAKGSTLIFQIIKLQYSINQIICRFILQINLRPLLSILVKCNKPGNHKQIQKQKKLLFQTHSRISSSLK